MTIYALVKRGRKVRKGRGFSQNELKQVGLSMKQAFHLGIPIDSRRSTTHQENVKALETHMSLDALDLIEIKGIGQKRSEQLKTAGFDTVRKLAESEPKQIAEKVGVSEKSASRWILNAKQILTEKA
jgi:hypothetical protein